jgi:hypothetical protein
MAIENPCAGSGQRPTQIRRLPLSVGSRFGGSAWGCCPEEGCRASVGKNGRLKKHVVEAGAFARYLQQLAAEPHDPNANDPRHLD